MSNNTFSAFGYKKLLWIEKGGEGYFRESDEYLRGSLYSLERPTGYYCDEFYDAIAVPAVHVTLIGNDDEDNEKLEYRAGVLDPYNDGSGIVDMGTVYIQPEQAAIAAHRLAECYAESEREYQAAESARFEVEDTIPAELKYYRKAHSRALPQADAVGARTRAELRAKVGKLVTRAKELKEQIHHCDRSHKHD